MVYLETPSQSLESHVTRAIPRPPSEFLVMDLEPGVWAPYNYMYVDNNEDTYIQASKGTISKNLAIELHNFIFFFFKSQQHLSDTSYALDPIFFEIYSFLNLNSPI